MCIIKGVLYYFGLHRIACGMRGAVPRKSKKPGWFILCMCTFLEIILFKGYIDFKNSGGFYIIVVLEDLL